MAKSKGITVCGIFWILDQLVKTGALTKHHAIIFLQDLQLKNKRLPEEECDKRLKKME